MAIKASFVVHDVFGDLMNMSRAHSNAVFIVWPESYVLSGCEPSAPASGVDPSGCEPWVEV